ncbi:MAG TPA: histidine kinase N-terminal 7TM domain-containing protein [Anaerolineales bacterium]|nr:histidine kinase N-terminal 7TM domain-containing protein [Anaerolineales bacterium]
MINDWFNYLPLIASIVLTVGVGIYAWRHHQSPGIKTFMYVTLAELSWSVGYLFELSSPSLAGKLFWDDFQFIGSMFVPFLLMIFAYEYTGQEKSISRRTRMLLIAFPILFLLLLYTNPLHALVRNGTAHIEQGKPFDTLLYDFTQLMWVSFFYSYGTYMVATILFVRNLFRQQRLFRAQTLVIVIGFVIPFLGTLPGAAGFIIFGQRDITPYTFGIANLIFAWGLFRYGLFDIVPIARDAVMENMSDAVIVLDSQSRVVDVNPSALDGLETTASQVIGLPVTQIFANRPDLIDLFKNIQPIREDVTYESPSGRRYVFDSFISPLRDQHNSLIGRLVVARDITEQRMVEAELHKTHLELESRVQRRTVELEVANRELEDKNAELERFTYTVSHDLKTPLVTISGYLGYLKEDVKTANMDRLEKDSQRIAGAVEKMQRLLNDLLELSRIGRMSNPFEAISFDGLVKEALDIVHGRLEERNITVQIQPNLPLVYGDKPRLMEVLQNLIDNAAKFFGDQPHPTIEIGVNGEENGRAIFFVKDNGIGIAPEYHEQIFGLFNRLDTQIEGTGIGLALVKRIIEIHGGRIWVESDFGEGSTFYFTLETTQ